MVTVRREALAVILPIVEIGLAHSDIEVLADLEEVITHLRTVMAVGSPVTVRDSH